MPIGFREFDSGCPGLPALGFTLDDTGCVPVEDSLSLQCDVVCPLGQYAQAVYDGSTENAGPGIRSTAASNRDSVFGLYAIYIPAQTGIALTLYTGEPAEGLGTVLDNWYGTLVPGDVVLIESDTVDATVYRVKVNDVTIITETIDEGTLDTANACVGFVVISAVADGTIVQPGGGEENAMIENQAADLNITTDTLQDTDLALAMEANETYIGHVVLRYMCASATPDMQFTFSGPSGSTGKWFDAAFSFEAFDLDEAVSYSVSAGFDTAGVFHFTVRNGANAGDLKFQVAQNVADATPLVVKQDSHMLMFKKV